MKSAFKIGSGQWGGRREGRDGQGAEEAGGGRVGDRTDQTCCWLGCGCECEAIKAGESLNILPIHISFVRLKGLLVGKHLAFRDTSWKTISCFFQSAPVVNALWLYFYYRYKLLFFELLLCTWQHYMPYEHYLIYSACQPSKLDKYFSILSLSQLSF